MAPTLIAFEQFRDKGLTLSKCQIWRLERDGKFPRRVRLSAARVAWVESEVDAYIAARVNDRAAQRKAAASPQPQVA